MRDGPEIEELGGRSDGPTHDGRGPAPRHRADGRLGGSSAGLVRGMALVAALIAVAVLKPWSVLGLTPAQESVAPATPGPVTARTAAAGLAAKAAPGGPAGPGEAVDDAGSPAALAPGQLGCGAPDGWRLVTLGWLAGRGSSTQTAADPLVWVTGAADPAIVSIPAGEAPVVAVGACEPGPVHGAADPRPQAPAVRILHAWRLDARAAVAVPVRTHGPAAGSAEVVQLYAPGSGTWGPGRYVLQIGTGSPDGAGLWLGFTVAAPPPAQQSAAPAGWAVAAGSPALIGAPSGTAGPPAPRIASRGR